MRCLLCLLCFCLSFVTFTLSEEIVNVQVDDFGNQQQYAQPEPIGKFANLVISSMICVSVLVYRHQNKKSSIILF